ncbi:hypothetical protein HAX54_017378 [Datura stramonium]|uniref:Uncharacterized protein n=1 Tax=Datura stramonium TaxID=4076 RepID=A0ABS8S147_DATST|nr:hypothetical protein [Datura stramonium]
MSIFFGQTLSTQETGGSCFLVAASIAAYAVKQINVKPSKRSSDPLAKNSENETRQNNEGMKRMKRSSSCIRWIASKKWLMREEEKEEVKLINGIINPAQGTGEREVKLEGELLEYYGLKEQESDILELQKQLKIKSVEIDMLNITINTLQAEKQKLQEEVFHGTTARKDLEAARSKIKELQRQMQLEANQTKAQLLLLKFNNVDCEEKEEEVKRDSEVDKKLKLVKELEVEVMELKRKNKELQHEKRELVIKLMLLKFKIANLSNMTEDQNVGKGDRSESNFSQPSSPGSEDFDNQDLSGEHLPGRISMRVLDQGPAGITANA